VDELDAIIAPTTLAAPDATPQARCCPEQLVLGRRPARAAAGGEVSS